MARSIRAVALAAAAAAALAAAAGASAALTPRLVVTGPNLGSQLGPVNILATTKSTDDAVGKLQIYAPRGYTLSADVPSPGARIGTASATAVAADLQGKSLTLKGTLVAVDPKDPALVQQSAACDDTTHSLVWMLRLTGGGQSFELPVFVDQTTGSDTQFSPFRLVVCFGAPDVPAGTPGRATAGARFIELGISTTAIVSPTATGEYRWRSAWTPYVPKTATLAAADTREAQALVRTPTYVSLKATKKRVVVKGKPRMRVTLTGFLTEHAVGIPAVRVSLQAGPTRNRLSRFDTVSTDAKGRFVKTVTLRKPSSFMAEVTIPLRSLGTVDCKTTFGADVQCATVTVGGSHVLSAVVRVR